MQITSFVDTRFFTVEKWKVSGQSSKTLDQYTLVSVLEGEGRIKDMDGKKDDHLILTALCHNPLLSGNLTLLISWIDDSLEQK